jgi:hypothetical protein
MVLKYLWFSYDKCLNTGEIRSANRERLPRVRASPPLADPRRAAPPPGARDAPGILTMEAMPTAFVWTAWRRGRGSCGGLWRHTLA